MRKGVEVKPRSPRTFGLLRYALVTLSVITNCIAMAEISEAATYYVSPSGNNSNSCSAAQAITTPKQSISNFLANCSLSAGDTLYIRGGTYVERVTRTGMTGASGNYITISEYPGETVIIRPPAGSGSAMALYDVAWVKIVGIEFDCIHNTGSGCFDVNSNNNNFEGVWVDSVIVKNNGREGLQANCANTDAFAAAQSEGWYQSGSHISGRNTKITNSEFSGNGAHGLYSGGIGLLIDGINTHDNCLKGFQKYPGGDHYTIRNSRFHNNKNDDGLGMYSAADSNSYIYNNLIYNNGGSGLVFRYGESRNFVYFNTIYNNNCAGAGIGGIDDGGADPPTSATIKNNIVFGNCGKNISSGSPSTLSNNLTTDPGFVNAGAGDFHLKATSPAVGTGTVVDGVTTDMEGRIRGASVDIGAYQYQGAPVSSVPSPPLNLRLVP